MPNKTTAIATALLCGAALLGMGAYLLTHAQSGGVALGGFIFLGLGLTCLAAGGIACQVEA